MISKRKLLRKSRLYLIVDKNNLSGRPLIKTINLIKESAIDIIQLRDKISEKPLILKEATRLSNILRNKNIIFIVNDHPDIARISGSDGVHLGQSDTSIGTARRILGYDKIIGISCHSLKQAVLAQDEGADYIGMGPIFKTNTKPKDKPIGLKLIEALKKEMRIPVFALGGINLNNIGLILKSGIKTIAVSSAILSTPNIPNAIKQFSERLA